MQWLSLFSRLIDVVHSSPNYIGIFYVCVCVSFFFSCCLGPGVCVSLSFTLAGLCASVLLKEQVFENSALHFETDCYIYHSGSTDR